LIILAACTNAAEDPEKKQNDSGELDILSIDNDGDGLSENEGDCDDSNPEISPEQPEVCDGIDNDCDALIDTEDDSFDTSSGIRYYLDQDGDGFGDENTAGWTCEMEEGYVAGFGDCDDSNPEIHPEALEICDSIDNDCDNGIDDEDSQLDEGTLYYEDFDQDGYGDPGMSTLACIQPDGYILDNQDCDDTDPERYPIDSDGDGLTRCDTDCDDEDPLIGATDFDGDGAIACINDCNDMDPSLNQKDADNDGLSTCDGDCNDFDPLILDIDNDGDGYSACFLDCDDTNPYISPLIDLDQDGVDYCSDCNDNNASIGSQFTAYMDSDADGFGSFDTVQVCDLDIDGDGKNDYTTTFGDCNDLDHLTYPGAAFEDSTSLCLQDSDGDGYGALGICLSFSLYDRNGDGWDASSSIEIYIDNLWYESIQLTDSSWGVVYHCYPEGATIDIGYLSGPENAQHAFTIFSSAGQVQYQSLFEPTRADISAGDPALISLSLTASGGSDSDDLDENSH